MDLMFKVREFTLLFEAENGYAVEMRVRLVNKDASFIQVTRLFSTGPFGGHPKPAAVFRYPLHPIYHIAGTIY